MDENVHVWRAPMRFRIFFSAVAALLIGGALTPWDDQNVGAFPPDGSGDYRHGFGYRVLLIACAGGLLAWTYRARMDLRREEVVMRYLLWSRRIVVSEIANVAAGREGLTITTCDGREHASPMLIGTKAPIASWLHRTTHADRIARTILEARP